MHPRGGVAEACHVAELEVEAIQALEEAGAGPDFAQGQRQAGAGRDLQQAGHERAGPPHLVGLGRGAHEGLDGGVMLAADLGDQGGGGRDVGGGGIDRRQGRLGAGEHQVVQGPQEAHRHRLVGKLLHALASPGLGKLGEHTAGGDVVHHGRDHGGGEGRAEIAAALHLNEEGGEEGLGDHDRGGLEVLGSSIEAFSERLSGENHTLKRSLTDPRIFSGIGNAYSDEILHRAKLSPVAMTQALSDSEMSELFNATREVLTEWTERLQEQAKGEFPEKVTAFRPEMAVHGKFGEPCPVCDAAVQKISYAANETNYCPRCQTDGKMLADRALSQLLKKDWPKSIDDWEEKFR